MRRLLHAVGEWTDSVHPLHSQAPTDPWDTLDELAFAGEAIFEYLTLPYLLAEPDAVVDATMKTPVGVLRVLGARYAAALRSGRSGRKSTARKPCPAITAPTVKALASPAR
jgi:hypothetical protein